MAARKTATKTNATPATLMQQATAELSLPTLSLGRRLDQLNPKQFQIVSRVVASLEHSERGIAADDKSGRTVRRGALLILEDDDRRKLDHIYNRLCVFARVLSEGLDLEEHQITEIGSMLGELSCDVYLLSDDSEWSDFVRLLNTPEAVRGLLMALPDAVRATCEREAAHATTAEVR